MEPSELAAENERLRTEVERLKDEEAAAGPRGPGRGRRVLVWILVVLTCISLILATIGVWANRTVWNTDRYVALVEPLASDPAVQQALAAKLTDAAFTALNVQQRVSDVLGQIKGLPAEAAFLSGPIAAGAKDLIQRQVQAFVSSQTFQDLWVQVNTVAHQKLVALLNGDYSQLPNVTVEGGVVRLNLVSAVARLLQQLVQTGANSLGIDVTIPDIPPDLDAADALQRLSSAVGVTLPSDFGQVTIMTQAQLESYQTAAHRVKQLATALVLLTVILFALALALSRNRRRTLISLGVGIVIAIFVSTIALRNLRARILDAIVSPGARGAARDVFTTASASLRHIAFAIFWIALVVAIAAYLLGRPRWFMRAVEWVRTKGPDGRTDLERWAAPRIDAVRIGAIVVAALILFITGLSLVWIIIVGLALAATLWWLSNLRRAQAEA